MKRVRRSKYLLFHLRDGKVINIVEALKGQIVLQQQQSIFVLSIITREVFTIPRDELPILLDIPSGDWTTVAEVESKNKLFTNQLAYDWASKGFVLVDDEQGCFAELRERHRILDEEQWSLYAATYHFMTHWEDVDVGLELPPDGQAEGDWRADTMKGFREFVAVHGKPPQHFHSAKGLPFQIDLPIVRPEHPLYDLLEGRKTTRSFCEGSQLEIEELATILYYVFGCHGYTRIMGEVVGLKKTSPSGGGLHPTEVYILVMKVADLNPGLYHYNVERHRLDQVEPLEEKVARELANEFTSGQEYPKHAAVLFLMTARFYRNYWKYRRHQKAYGVLLMDVAHLSQTLYLICEQLGLGAFITAAINGGNIEKRLGLQGFQEGAIAICGCGKPSGVKGYPDPEFTKYLPRATKI